MKKCENVTLIGERSLFRATYLKKIGPLHIFFIILMNPAKEYLYTREIIENFKEGIFFYP